MFQGLAVKDSQWGLGTFLTEDVKAGDLLAGAPSFYHCRTLLTMWSTLEYTGELIYEPTADSREYDLFVTCVESQIHPVT